MQYDEDRIVTNPEDQDIDEVLTWLKRERDNDSRRFGFYNNKDTIKESFERGCSIVFKHGNKTIGLVTWWEEEEFKVNIDIFVIHPNYRSQGFGRLYYKFTSDYFRNKGFKVVKLFCEPKASESFWTKMRFIKFPNCGLTEHNLTYYKILVDTASTTYISNVDRIELWDVEPYQAKNKEPKWVWYIEIEDEILLYPIIQPCNCNWKLRWSRNGTILKEGKVKYFTDFDDELYNSQFLYIDELCESMV